METVVRRAAEELGGLHTLVHAGGPHVPMRHLSRVGAAEMAEQLQLDAAGFFAVARAAAARTAATRGSLVAVTTAATARFPVRDGLSSAPKAAVEAIVRGLAAEEGRFGVRVNCVGPGMLTDGMAARLIASGELDEHALAVTRGNIPLRRFGLGPRRRRGGGLPRLSPGRRSSPGRSWTWTVATPSDACGGELRPRMVASSTVVRTQCNRDLPLSRSLMGGTRSNWEGAQRCHCGAHWRQEPQLSC